MNLLRRFLTGGVETGGLYCGAAGGGAVIVGAGAPKVGPGEATVGPNNSTPQFRQNPSPGAAGVPHFGHIVAFNVGSLIRSPPMIVHDMRSRWEDASIEKGEESQQEIIHRLPRLRS
jgi:hypothetical protein